MNAYLRSEDIHVRVNWPTVLAQLGVGESFLKLKKNGPCPHCGGRDRFTFSNRKGRGDFLCRHCTPRGGDGFELLCLVHRWTFGEARRQVMAVARLSGAAPEQRPAPRKPAQIVEDLVASPSARVRAVVRGACAVADCPDAVSYLESRGLWPLPTGCTLRAHSSLEYWADGLRSRYPGLVAEVRDINGEPVTCHVTYLEGGKKIPGSSPRKMLSGTAGREGCAVRLMHGGDVLGIAEGIETALSAAKLHGVPVWAALNTSLLRKYVPPPAVKLLHVFADRDVAGLEAAGQLMQRLQGRVRLELHVPPPQYPDFNDQLTRRDGGGQRDE